MSQVQTFIRSGIEAALELLSPTRCAGCEYPGALLCTRCREALAIIDVHYSCKRCGAPFGYLICTECNGEEWNFSHNYSLSSFEPPLSRTLVIYKDHQERRLASVLGALLAEGFCGMLAETGFWPEGVDLVTWIPSTKEAMLRRGFDHAFQVAGAMCDAAKLPKPQSLFARRRVSDQRALDRAERAKNVAGSFELVVSPEVCRGAKILLIDDVFTTGATLDEASGVLRDAGVDDVMTATLARVW